MLLRRRTPTATITWSTGSAVAFIDQPTDTARLLLGVRCRIGSLDYDEQAMLDTAAHWSVLGADLAEELAGELGTPLEIRPMSTRLGSFSASVFRVPIRLVADEGQHLDVDATAAILDGWQGPTILGFYGFIERIRIAFDPGAANEDPMVFFGKP